MKRVLNSLEGKSLISKLFIVAFPVCLVAIGIFSISKSPMFIIQPNGNGKPQRFLLSTYTDDIHHGNSTIEIIANRADILRYKYVLKSGHKFRFAMLEYAEKDSSYINLSGYDQVNISIRSKRGQRIQLFLITYDDHIMLKNGQILGNHSIVHILNVTDSYQRITIPLKDFKTPDWWLSEHKITESELKYPNFGKTKIISLSNCINLGNDIEDTIEVNELSFETDYTLYYVVFFIFLLVYGVLIWIFKVKNDRKKELIFTFDGNDQIFHMYSSDLERIVFEYITQHYSNPELSQSEVQKATGLSEIQIASLVKKKTGITFRQFLNKLRLTEAKRLLKETDLNISEIAYKTGYGNISHFNRVFKEEENCSPNELRKASKG